MKTPPPYPLLILSLLAGLLCVPLTMRGAAPGGGLDPTFNYTGYTFTADTDNHFTSSIVLQPDGKIVVNGIFDPSSQPPTHTVIRLNTDGSVDTGFNVTMSEYGYVDEAALQADGKILIAGEFTTVNGTASNGLARLNTDGSLDSSFTPANLPSPFYGLIVQPDGKILVVSSATNSISRLNSDGSVDANFTALANAGTPIALQTNGKILCTDSFLNASEQYNCGVIRMNADGTADTSFSGVVFDGGNSPDAIVEQPDGKIIVAGNFNTVSGVTHTNIVRLNADSTVDTGFNASTDVDSDTGDTNGQIFAVALQPDGKVLIGGAFTEVDGVTHRSLARLNTDGTLDTSFATGAINSADLVTAVAVQPDGKVVAGGALYQVLGTKQYLVDRFDPHPAFFSGEVSLSVGVDYLELPNGNPFGYYSYLSDEDYLFHFDLGYEYVFDAGDENNGVYLYDFASSTFFYTSPVFPFPYLYDFTLGTVLYYYADTANPGHYTTNPRYFYDFATGGIIMK